MSEYARHSAYSDPGVHAALVDALPPDLPALTAVIRNLVVHYRGSGIAFTDDRLAELDSRWVERILDTDQHRFGVPLDVPRPEAERVAGCCRDFTLLTVAALRQRGVPARSRVGFASYFAPDFHHDHVVAEYFDGDRWVWVDAELDPGLRWPFDPCDVPRPSAFASAADVWTAYRRGEVDADRYGVGPDLPLHGEWFIYDEVLIELAHRMRDELLLWDTWGAMADPETGTGADDVALVDEVAALLLAADRGDHAAERELAERYAADRRLHPGDRVRCFSPTGRHAWVDLRAREEAVAG
jgi:Transglutaminase-like superfamily